MTKPIPGTVSYAPPVPQETKEHRSLLDKIKELEARIKRLEYYMNRIVSD